MDRPLIGVTCDTVPDHTPEQWKYESPHAYCRAVVRCGGTPILLPYEPDRIADYLELCDGFLFTGGDDPDMTAYGQAIHPEAKLMHAQRQAFELALYRALDATAHPVLGVCLGMQMMALHHGGRLHQHLPDVEGFGDERAAQHRKNIHVVAPLPSAARYLPRPGAVHSRHHQAVADPGALEVLAEFDGVIEAVAPRDTKRFYLGVQWHPEATEDATMGDEVIRRFVEACAAARATIAP